MCSTTSSHTQKVLVVDDDEGVVTPVEHILRLANYEPITATEWTEALDAIEHDSPDLILLDLKMPHIDGAALLKFIRKQGYDVPVIVVSGYITDRIASELIGFGVCAFVWKPFTITSLQEEIERAIGSAPSNQQSPGDLLRGLERFLPQQTQTFETPLTEALQDSVDSPVSGPEGETGSGSFDRIVQPADPGQAVSPPPALSDSELSAPDFPPAPPPLWTGDLGQTLELETPEAPESEPKVHRHRYRRMRTQYRMARRRTFIYLGIITLACFLLAGFLSTIQSRYGEDLQKEISSKAEQSLKEQQKKELELLIEAYVEEATMTKSVKK